MTICSIDPGASGGIAWRWPKCKVIAVKMPATNGDIIRLLKAIITTNNPYPAEPVIFYLEDLVKFTRGKRPESTTAVYASNWGILSGAVQYSGCVLHLIRPQLWQKTLSLGSSTSHVSKTKWKNHLKAYAQRTFPHQEVTLATADALCLLQFAIEQNKEFIGL